MTQMSPIDWAKRPLQKYAVFSGRAPRAEYWWFYLAVIIGYLVASIIDSVVGLDGVAGPYGIITLLWWVAVLVPSIAAGVRRLHDTNRSGFWLLAPVVPYVLAFALGGAALASGGGMASLGIAGLMLMVGVVAAVVVLVFLILPGNPGDNRYGPSPYGAGSGAVAAA